MYESSVALELFLAWLNENTAHHFDSGPPAGESATANDGETRLAVEVRPLLGPVEDAEWLAARERLAAQTADGLPARIAVWVPAGAELPAGEPHASEFAERVRQAALKLGPAERSHVQLPVSLYLRKSADSGGVISVTGALNPHWARFTGRVQGTYDLDSTHLHRLPESEEHLEALIDRIVEVAGTLDAGRIAPIETIDAWTVQRLGGSDGVTIIAVPPALAEDAGLAVRRNFRRLLAEAAPALREREADLRALILVGYYPRIEQEGATTALRGYDPALYAGIDYICLVADGVVKPLITRA